MNKTSGRSYLLSLACVLFISLISSPCGLGAEAESQRPKKSKRIELKGSRRFTNQVTKALELLKEGAPEAYEIVTEYVRRIQQGKHSGMWAYKMPPTYEMADETTFYSVTWCAGSIAHDSLHSKFFHDYKKDHSGSVPDEVWVGEDAEKKCIRHQLEVLKKIGAPKHEIDYCSKLKATHHDVDKDGKYDWKDYKKRDW